MFSNIAMLKSICILNYNSQSIGVKVIIDALKKNLSSNYEVQIVSSLRDVNKNVKLFTYGPKETYEALKSGYNVDLSLMVDYHTLSLKNRTKFLIKNGYLFSKSTIRSLLGYFLYYYREWYISKHCDKYMFVSQSDIDLFRKRFPNAKCYCVPNGVDIPEDYIKERTSSKLSLGILSGWTPGTFIEAKWFIDHYWPKIIKEVDVELVVCGKFATQDMIEYFERQQNVTFIGPVDQLSLFFNLIDIYVATKPIGCGILNKVLDAFAYKTLTIGIKESFTGFSYMKDSLIVCEKVDEFVKILKLYHTNPSMYGNIVNNATYYIKLFNNWDKNYNKFIKDLQADGTI